jgi:hypothetical protein
MKRGEVTDLILEVKGGGWGVRVAVSIALSAVCAFLC